MSTQPQSIPLNRLPIQLELSDALALHKKDVFLSLNSHHIGTIQEFNALNQTARVTINYQKTFYDLDSLGNYVATQVPYPVLADCPVISLGGGATSLTFPISIGDECLILFNDRDIDNWFVSGANTGGVLNSPRRHSFSDGLILVGIRSLPNVLSSFSSTHAVLRNNAGAQVGVNATAGTALIQGTSGTLGAALQTFCSAVGSASTVSQIASAATALGSTLGGILE